jgi:Protein of unknown function (DUF1761)
MGHEQRAARRLRCLDTTASLPIMDDLHFNFAAIFVAALMSFAIGGLWYSLLLFARAWMKEAGLTEQQTKDAPMGRIFGLAAVASLVMAFNLAAFIGPKASLGFGLFAAAGAAIGKVAMSLGVISLDLSLRAAITETLAHQQRLPGDCLYVDGGPDRGLEMSSWR